METYGNPILEDIQFNQDGSLKKSGKQNIKFYKKKFLDFKARPLLDEDGNQVYEINEKTKKKVMVFDIDPKTGLPFKDAFENERLMIRVETKGDTNIKDDFANELDKRTHYREYKFFAEGKMPTGHPIEDFDFIQPNIITELHMLGVHVLEEVAAMSDIECEQLKDQPGYELRDIAKQWVTINSPQGLNAKTLHLEKKIADLEAKLFQVEGKKEKRILPIEEPPFIPEEPIKVMEMTHEEAAKNKPGRKRLV